VIGTWRRARRVRPAPGKNASWRSGFDVFCRCCKYPLPARQYRSPGMRFSWRRLTRLALRQVPITLDPGFQGGIALTIHNLSSAATALRTGSRIAELVFSQVTFADSRSDAPSALAELAEVKRVFPSGSPSRKLDPTRRHTS